MRRRIELPRGVPLFEKLLGELPAADAEHVRQHGYDPIGVEGADPVSVQDFVMALEKAQNDALAAERTAQALPFIVASLHRHSSFPQQAMAPIYANLLTLFALGAARDHGTYESSQILIHALLAVGLNDKAYRALIADVQELAGSGFGVGMIYWILEIVEDFMRFSSPSVEARETFLHSVLSKVAPIYSRLSILQRAAISTLAEALGWTLSTFGMRFADSEKDDLAKRLEGRSIAIYTLTESSGRQAKTALEEAASNATVDCNADQAGTPRLRALAENADLFVLTSLSAKHAATDFIRKHRKDRPLLYAQGRGFSSILRAIEDYLVPPARSALF